MLIAGSNVNMKNADVETNPGIPCDDKGDVVQNEY